MKQRNALTLCSALLVLSIAASRAQPLVRVSIRSYGELSNAVFSVVGAVKPDDQEDIGGDLADKLGLTSAAKFDPKAPWELALWQQGGAPGVLVALKGPISDVKQFKGALSPDGLLNRMGKDWVQMESGIGVIVFKSADAQTEPEKAELKDWEKESVSTPRRALQLVLSPSESVKAQILPFLSMARMAVTQKATAGAGAVNPHAMGQVFELYFDGIETFIKGLQELKLAAGVDNDALVMEQSISATPGSDLAGWFHKPANAVKEDDLKALTPNALASAAMALDKNARLIDLSGKFLRLSMQMQGVGTDDTDIKDLTAMMGKCLPMRVAGSVFFKDHLEFSGVYRFPESDAATAYGQMKPFIQRLIKTQAGEGKLYSEASFKEDFRKVNGIPVDRGSFTINLDNPLYKQPGQKELTKALWPNGKVEFDYAVKDNKLLAATPRQMEDLISGKTQSEAHSVFAVNDSTIAAGYFNLVSAVRDVSTVNPAIPEPVKERMTKLDPKGTAVRFQVEMNTQVRSEEHVPLSLLKQFGRLKGEP